MAMARARLLRSFSLIAAVWLILAIQPLHAALPQTINYQGYLASSGGTPHNGAVVMTFRLYAAASGGSALWTEIQPSVTVTNGIFNAVLGSVTALTLPFDVPYYVTLTINADGEMSPRQALASSPYAFRAMAADSAATATTATTAATANAVAPASVTPAGLQSCGPSQILKMNGGGSAWGCAADLDTITTYTAASPLGLTGVQFRLTTCGANQILKMDGGGSAWGCAAEVAVPANPFVQGGNAFGASATLGTTDNQGVNLVANNSAVLRITPNATSPILVGGHSGNSVTAGAAAAFVGGGGAAGTFDSFVGQTCGTSCANRVTDHGGFVGGGTANQAGDAAGTTTDKPNATVSGGFRNSASGDRSTVGGGHFNTASGDTGTVSGGHNNTASGDSSSVGGGGNNVSSNGDSTVAGGSGNNASGDKSTIAGGLNNSASGQYSTVPGGVGNMASGQSSFAAGRAARTQTSGGTLHNGAFVWADNNIYNFYSTANNEFSARATGGVRFVTAIDGTGVPTAGVSVASGGGSWASLSDVRAKADFAEVDTRAVLASVAALPIRSWRYQSQDASIRHIGPTAQDFRAAFAVGESERTITTVDADGVALAAIQGLNEVVQEKEARILKLEAALARMQLELEQLKSR